ncbi:hypothetical protein Q4E93_33980 [Flavitalea sp. BT771]|uniref:hypothetical protein n=1 Tax=Flavitalea sp. BT771 TaxID=3063329 RepID=UPI0026E161F6|nr:hypothetical protein [Flavitalea sp. BT771]MDO6435673.1 hypothetical protein [Flavitalea sp. BT771]MDV6224574.1 hypothetical protein [Flavitalea sp. BT771]
MKKLIFFLGIIPAVLFSATCKNKDRSSGKIESVSDLKDASQTVEKNMKASSDRWAERRAKGDTLAIPYKDLEAYLPEINGYSKDGGPKGSQMSGYGMGAWSQAEQEYINGDKKVSVKIFDYNSAQQAFMGMTAMFGMGFSSEDDYKKQASVDVGVKNVAAYETLYKTEKKAEMVLVAGDRFIINIETNGEGDESFLRSVAKSINLGELASK